MPVPTAAGADAELPNLTPPALPAGRGGEWIPVTSRNPGETDFVSQRTGCSIVKRVDLPRGIGRVC